LGTNTSLFGSSNTEDKAASKRYTSLLTQELLKSNMETICKFVGCVSGSLWRMVNGGHPQCLLVLLHIRRSLTWKSVGGYSK
jgi:hypothetical protein